MTLLAATDLDRIKTWKKEEGTLSTAEDDQLSASILPVSKAIEGYLGRPLMLEARTEVVPTITPFARRIYLQAAPVTTVTSIKAAIDRDFASATAIDTDDYYVDLAGGVVHFDYPLHTTLWAQGTNYGNRAGGNQHLRHGTVQVIYSAGLASDLDALEAAYPDIVHAATLWVLEIYLRRGSLTKSATAQGGRAGGGSITYQSALRHPPEAVAGLLAPYRRLRMVA